jgi:quercetin dioxygenase-like cupin family protein
MAQRANLPANDNFGYIGKLVDLVEYQAVSITTKTLADKKVGKVDLFAFTEGQSLGEHLSRFDDLAYILDGEAEIKIADKIFHVKAGEMIVLPENQIHAIKAVKRFKMMLIMIKA